MLPRPGSNRARLAAKLREVRAVTGLSGNQFARQVGWPQSRVSKIETGVQFPTADDIETWLEAAAAQDESDVVLGLLTSARVESVSFRDEYREFGGAGAKQRSIGQRERQADRIASFAPAMVPGLLQTASFARELISLPAGPATFGFSSADDLEQMVAARIDRQAVLYDSSKALSFVIGEAALWIRFGSRQTQLGQLDRLQTLIGIGVIDLRIVPFLAAMPVAPLNGFVIYDDELVVVETLTGEHNLADQFDTRTYQELFRRVRESAVSGEQAVNLIQRVSREIAPPAESGNAGEVDP